MRPLSEEAVDSHKDNRWILQRRVSVPDNVIYRWFEKETLLLNLGSGQYHGLNPTGGRMLQLLEEVDGQVEPAIERLAGESGMQVDQIVDDLVDFLVALADRGLVEVDDDPRA